MTEWAKCTVSEYIHNQIFLEYSGQLLVGWRGYLTTGSYWCVQQAPVWLTQTQASEQFIVTATRVMPALITTSNERHKQTSATNSSMEGVIISSAGSA